MPTTTAVASTTTPNTESTSVAGVASAVIAPLSAAWIVANLRSGERYAGVVLDAASFANSTVDIPWSPHAALCVRAGYSALRAIADFFYMPYDPDPQQSDPTSVAREEFDDACRQLTEAGVPLKPDLDQAWIDFNGWRVNYDSVLIHLAALTEAPYGMWSSDRSLTGFRLPPLLRRRRSPGS